MFYYVKVTFDSNYSNWIHWQMHQKYPNEWIYATLTKQLFSYSIVVNKIGANNPTIKSETRSTKTIFHVIFAICFIWTKIYMSNALAVAFAMRTKLVIVTTVTCPCVGRVTSNPFIFYPIRALSKKFMLM